VQLVSPRFRAPFPTRIAQVQHFKSMRENPLPNGNFLSC
jgi:hypothetical protein